MMTLGKLKRCLPDPHRYLSLFHTTESVTAKKALLARVVSTFEQHFDANDRREVSVHFVPGRVEFLGKHTDYAGGHSIVMAMDRGFFAVSARNGTDHIRMAECQNPGQIFPPCDFAISPHLHDAGGDWTIYPKTMVQRIALNFRRSVQLQGVDIAFGCDLPVGGGMSGSSALMIMTFFALAQPNRLEESRRYQRNIQNRIDLAMYLACAENGQTFRELTGHRGVGTFGGSEDHTVILNGRRGALSLFRFCPTVHKADLMWKDEWALAICHSGVRAEKTKEALPLFNRASERARLVVEMYNRHSGTHHSLMRDIIDDNPKWTRTCLMERVHLACRQAAASDDLPGRFYQFYQEEQEIIPQTVAAWIRDDAGTVGHLVGRSHRNSKRFLYNIVREVDFLQRSARTLGAIAASGFGAGFGGSVYALIASERAPEFLKNWKTAYTRRFPHAGAESEFLLTTPASHAQEMFT